MKRIIYLLSAVLLLSSCDDFLDSEDLTSKTSGNFPADETDAGQMVSAIYATFNTAVNAGANTTYFGIAEFASDDRFGGGGENDKDPQASDHLMRYDESASNGFWAARYSGISRATTALAYMDNIADPETRRQKKGEALFLRAYFYFELAQLYERVPLLNKVPNSVEEAKIAPKQSPADSVYACIASDLKEAIGSDFSNHTDGMPAYKWNVLASGTASRWAAEALLARVYLFYTGFYGKTSLPLANGGAIEKAYVVDALNDCIANSGHDLLPDYQSLWPYSNAATKKNDPYAVGKTYGDWAKDGENEEQVFNLKFSYLGSWDANKLGFSNQYALFFGVRAADADSVRFDCVKGGVFPLGKGWGMGPVAPNLWNEWVADEPNDIRREASIARFTDADYDHNIDQMEETSLWQKKIVATRARVQDGNTIQDYVSFCAMKDYYGPGNDEIEKNKWNELGNFQTSNATDICLIRFADVLLMHSELTETAVGMNRVRQRVGLTPISYSLAALQKERRHELAFEGLRWGDMRRWGGPSGAYAATALAKQNGTEIWNKDTKTTMHDQGAGYVARYQATKGFFPIPKRQIDLAAGELTQNAGWDGSDCIFTSWN